MSPSSRALRREYPILGRRLALTCDDPRIAAMADRAFGHWLDLPAELMDQSPPVEMTVRVASERARGRLAHAPIKHAWLDGHFLSTSDDLRADSDLARGEAHIRLALDALEDQARFIHHVLEAHALQLLTQSGREPFHAAAVSDGQRAMLLAGPGGAGKSTLCYALVRAGWRLIADDVTFLEAGNPPRVWGNTTSIRLLPDAPGLFPELGDLRPQRLPNGKVKLEAPAPRRAPVGVPRALVVIAAERKVGAILSPMSPDAAITVLFARVAPGFDRYPDARAAALAIARGCAIVGLSPAYDPAGSASALTRWFEAEAAPA